MTEVISRNPFALLGDDDEVVAAPAAPKAAAKSAAPKKAEPAPAPTKTETKVADKPKGDYPRRGGYGRGGAAGEGPRDRNVPPRHARQENGDVAAPSEPRDASSRGEYRGRGRGFRGDRGGRGRGGRGRDFDRHSGSARVDSLKQEVTGGWGAPGSENDATAAEGGATLEQAAPGAEGKTEEVAEPAKPVEKTAEELAAEEERRKEEELIAKQKTLEQYLAELGSNKASLGDSTAAARQLNAGVDPNLLKSDKKYERKAEEDIFFVGKTKAAAAKAKQAKEQSKQFVDTNFRFAEEPSSRGGRGGRGGARGVGGDKPRGRGGRGGGRGGPAVNVADASAFPSLSK